jgi:septum formation protein
MHLLDDTAMADGTAVSNVVLASGSPRRRELLAAAGVSFIVMIPAIDDADAPADDRDPERFVMSLAWFKARQVLADASVRFGSAGPRWILAADTMCVAGGAVIGKPADAQDAARMVRGFVGTTHEVVTGMCVLDRRTGARRIFVDTARVTLGDLSDAAIADYAASGAWRGKAGGYNYAERLAAGWPLQCVGDPETVMGLPTRLILPALGMRGAS